MPTKSKQMTGDHEYFLFKSTQDSPKILKKLDQAILMSHFLSSGPRYLLWSKWLGFLLIFKINCIWMQLNQGKYHFEFFQGYLMIIFFNLLGKMSDRSHSLAPKANKGDFIGRSNFLKSSIVTVILLIRTSASMLFNILNN